MADQALAQTHFEPIDARMQVAVMALDGLHQACNIGVDRTVAQAHLGTVDARQRLARVPLQHLGQARHFLVQMGAQIGKARSLGLVGQLALHRQLLGVASGFNQHRALLVGHQRDEHRRQQRHQADQDQPQRRADFGKDQRQVGRPRHFGPVHAHEGDDGHPHQQQKK
jgi:hypothetical protein